MPEGQEPVSTATVVNNKGDLKVYSRVSLNSDWEKDTSLVCTGFSSTNNLDIGTASFYVLEDGNSASDYIEYPIDRSIRQYNAASIYRCDLSDGYLSPYYVKVTSIVNGQESAIFYGYISSVTADLTSERTTALALSYAGLLDQVEIYGGWYQDRLDIATYCYDYTPVYNPKGIGNKGTTTYTPTRQTSSYISPGPNIYEINCIDETLRTKTNASANKFTIEDMINTVWARCTGNINGTQNTPWSCFQYLYNGPLSLLSLADLSNAPDVSDYTLQGKTVWAALVELVESVEGLSITERINYNDPDPLNGHPYIAIVDLKQ